MFIGHIPAGYITTKAVFQILPRGYTEKIHLKYALFWGMLGSIFPDLDMFYFYFIDNSRHLHHGYWTHLPFYYLCIFFLLFSISFAFRKHSLKIYLTVFSMNIFIHLFLDTIAGKIRWLYPFSSHDFVFFNVPARHHWWVWNFVFHWTFLFEIILTAIALFLIIRDIRRSNKTVIMTRADIC
ncbi:Hydrolase domain-containing protein [Desulfonema magnum]|uniref:Hydrolase domain-containing protein n=1 Tax=Desulfonema magnum TaxID=45655 RepID=A0A975BH03_9BACT|nr:Hydrolase domain-containing protein [Desulfonema magnum]